MGGRNRQYLPVRGPDRLRDDLGDDEYGERQDSTEDPDRRITEHHGRLGASQCRTHRVGDGVQGENRGDRFLDLSLGLLEPGAGPFPTTLQDRDVGVGRREKDRLQDRTQEGDREGQRDDEEECSHVLRIAVQRNGRTPSVLDSGTDV